MPRLGSLLGLHITIAVGIVLKPTLAKNKDDGKENALPEYRKLLAALDMKRTSDVQENDALPVNIPKGSDWLAGRHDGLPEGSDWMSRQGDALPDFLPLRFSVEGNEVALNLRKSDHVSPDAPFMILKDSTMKLLRTPDYRDFEVYQDAVREASILVQTKPRGESSFDMQYYGSYREGNKMYMLTKTTPNARQSEGSLSANIGSDIYQVEEVSLSNDLVFPEQLNISEGTERMMRYKEDILKMFGQSADLMPSGKQFYAVELLLVLDYAIYRRWLSLSEARTESEREQEAVRNLRFHYAHVINGVDMRYASIRDADYTIYIRLAGIIIAQTPSDSPWTELYPNKEAERYTEAYRALDDFEVWLLKMRGNLPPFDQATLFSGNFLFSGIRNDGSRRQISGLADIMGVCNECRPGFYCGASINVDNGVYAAIQTAAHELGHNLGAYHDGSPSANTCNGRDQYVMASSPGNLDDGNFNNPFRFSSCSEYAFENHMRFLTIENRNCLSNQVTHFSPSFFNRQLESHPGQEFDPNDQCYLLYGRDAYYCGGGSRDEAICKEMRCYVPYLKACQASTEQRASDGTTCGNKKWCMGGECMSSSEAPAAPETCVYGDYRGQVLRDPNLSCPEMVRLQPWRCYEDFFSAECCESCERIRDTAKPGCEYGDQDQTAYCAGIQRRECYEETVRNITCCETCDRRANNDIPGCRFGDRASWCTELSTQKHRCYREQDTCCETCNRLRNGPAGCEYGNKLTWCDTINRNQCYSDEYVNMCCDFCQRNKVGPKDCEWGDRSRSCYPQDCQDPGRWRACCHTCASFIAATAAPPTQPPVTTMPPPLPPSDKCRNKADYCSTLPSRDCYYYNDTCCQTCTPLYTGVKGCEFGDQVSWCGRFVKSPEMCDMGDISELCCATCPAVRGGAGGFTPLPPVTPENTCLDKASWCPTINSGFCYSVSTEETCCATCTAFRTNDSNCEFGDRFSWCRPEHCASSANDCCATCPA